MDYKKVLLLHFTQGLSGRSIAEVTGVSKITINEFLKRFRESKELYYPLPEDVTNETIAALLYKKAGNPSADLYRDFNIEDVHRALTRKGETLKHLWKKYNAAGIVGLWDGSSAAHIKHRLIVSSFFRKFHFPLGARQLPDQRIHRFPNTGLLVSNLPDRRFHRTGIFTQSVYRSDHNFGIGSTTGLFTYPKIFLSYFSPTKMFH